MKKHRNEFLVRKKCNIFGMSSNLRKDHDRKTSSLEIYKKKYVMYKIYTYTNIITCKCVL